MGRAVKDLGAVKLLNNPSPKSNSPKKGLLRLALDLDILGVIDFWKSHFLTNSRIGFWCIDHQGFYFWLFCIQDCKYPDLEILVFWDLAILGFGDSGKKKAPARKNTNSRPEWGSTPRWYLFQHWIQVFNPGFGQKMTFSKSQSLPKCLNPRQALTTPFWGCWTLGRGC